MPHGPRFEKLTSEVKSRIQEITPADALKEQANGTLLIDVRETEEFAAEHATGSMHLSKGVIEVKIEHVLPNPETKIICYCGGGYRSALVADNLQKMGYTNVKSMIGGYKAWKSANLPTES